MKILWVSLAALSFSFAQGNAEYQIDPKPVISAMKEVEATQVSLALIRDDEFVGSQSFGPNSKQVYQVGFLSRIPALMILLQMVDAGKISLDKPVTAYLKTAKLPSNPFLKGKPMLVRDLLIGQSGFSDYKFDGYATGEKVRSLAEELASAEVTFEPQSKVVRSATNSLVLQLLLEETNKTSFASLADSRVFKPLGLKSSFYSTPPSEVMVEGSLPTRFYPELAAQGMWSSAADIAKMASILMKSAQGTSKFLKPETAKLLFTAVKDGATFGLNREPLSAGGNVYLGGQTAGFSCLLRLMPEDGIGAVVLSNADMGWNAMNVALDASFKALTTLKIGDSAASFEPFHVSGEYAGNSICPVCEYMIMPLAFLWAQNDTDENLIKLGQALEKNTVAFGPKAIKTFIVLSNLSNDFPTEKARAEKLAKDAGVKNVAYVVIKDSLTGILRNYAINRSGKNTVYLVRNRKVEEVIQDIVSSPDSDGKLSRSIGKLVAGTKA